MKYQLITPLLPLKDEYTVVERVFAARGMAPEDVQHYLNTTIDDILDPATIERIDEGVKMLISHIAQEDKIFIQVDSDCDGYTSAALLINYINTLFPGFAQNNIIYRLHEGKQHGLILDTIPDDVGLVIAPDSSSNDYEVHKELYEKGIEVLVIDHHEAEKVSDYACVVNNQLCDYPTKSLSGVGMVYKFCSYIDKIMGEQLADDFLDLVALGLIGDMMDLRDFETKELIERGLNGRIRNPFFRQMNKVQNFSITKAGGLNPFSIGFYIAPAINAMNRFGSDREKMLLFESMLEFKAYEMIPSTKRGCKGQYETRVEQACRTATNVKKHQDKEVENSCDLIESVIRANGLLNNKLLIITLDKSHSIDRNLTGLIANKFTAKYQRPTLLLIETPIENAIVWSGSGRGYVTTDFDDLRGFCRDSGLCDLAEGHANACGIIISDENLEKFIEYSNRELADCEFTPCTIVDFIWHGYDFTGKDVLDIAGLDALWGQGLPQPIIALENLHVSPSAINLMSRDKKPTLKILLSNGVSLIKFGSSIEEYEQLMLTPETGSIVMNILGKCAINDWNGAISPQIIVSDMEIVGQTLYYF